MMKFSPVPMLFVALLTTSQFLATNSLPVYAQDQVELISDQSQNIDSLIEMIKADDDTSSQAWEQLIDITNSTHGVDLVASRLIALSKDAAVGADARSTAFWFLSRMSEDQSSDDNSLREKTVAYLESEIPYLITLLKNPDRHVRASVANLLGNIGEPAKSTIPHLVTLLKELPVGHSENMELVANSAIDALGKMKKSSKASLPQLILLLKDSNPLIRWHAVRALTAMKEYAKPAIPYLTPLLKDSDPRIREAVADALLEVKNAP
jgi:hypothetical protein